MRKGLIVGLIATVLLPGAANAYDDRGSQNEVQERRYQGQWGQQNQQRLQEQEARKRQEEEMMRRRQQELQQNYQERR